MSDRWLIAVTAGRWQRQSIKWARQCDYKVIAIDSDPKALGFEYADKTIIENLDDFDAIIVQISDQLSDQIGELNIQGVVSICSDVGMILAARLRKHYGVNTGPNIEVSHRLINKKLQREIWRTKGICKLDFCTGSEVGELVTLAKNFKLPFIIKPVDSAGSRGVFKIDNIDDQLIDKFKEALSYSATTEVIIETYMPGTEFTVETFSHQGEISVLCITEKKKIAAADGLVAYELATASLDASVQEKISSLVSDALTSLGYENGPGHTEVILMADGSIGIVEVAGRGGGFLVFEEFIEKASGFDIVNQTIQQAMGEPVTLEKSESNHATLHFFPNQAGRVRSISGFDQANDIDGITAESFIDVGATLEEPRCDGDRMGYFISVSADKVIAEHNAATVKSLIHYEIVE